MGVRVSPGAPLKGILKMHTKTFHKAESAFELAKIITFVFWMPIIVLTMLALIID